MVSFTQLLITVSAAVGALALPSEVARRAPTMLSKRAGTPNAEGTHDGYFFSWWSDGGAQATYTNLAGGEYSITWGSGGNLVGGKGWNPGKNRVISYSGSYSYNGNSYLAAYGWTRNPLVEYYVVENFGTYNPSSGAQRKGTVTSDGGTYDVLVSTRTNQPSIDGTKTFQQYWSVRQQKRTGGTINMDTHFKAWSQQNMPLGNHYYQVLACEGYFSTGSCRIKVSEGSGGNNGGNGGTPSSSQQPSSTQQPTQPTNGGGNGGGNCAAKWGQCGGQGYNGPTCCSEGSCRSSNQWYSQCI